jgi:antirestriction protein
MSDKPTLYIASLSDYNNGVLHGVHVDVGEDMDEVVWPAINAMLAASPTTKRYGDKAEEWAIHDHENFGGFNPSEYADLNRLHDIAVLMEEHGIEAVAGYLINDSSADLDEFTDHYRGVHESFKAYVTGMDSDILGFDSLRAMCKNGYDWDKRHDEGVEEMISKIEGYIDWDAVARDWEHGYSTHRGTEGLHVYED